MPASTNLDTTKITVLDMPRPGLPNFEYVRPGTPAEVVELLLRHGDAARLLLGGTDLFVQMRDGLLAPQVIIDVKHLPGMTEIAFDPDAGLQMGAAVNMNAMARHPAVVEHYPLLVEAAQTVASYQLRTRATMGGNLCNASPAADTAPAALVLEVTLVAWGPDGERRISATEFFTGPGAHVLQPGEFLTRIEFPVPPAGWAGRYLKLGRNARGDLAIVGVAGLGYPDQTAVSGHRFRIALASVAPTPIRAPEAEAFLAEGPITDEVLAQAAKLAQNAARPIDDLRGSAHYRKAMVNALARRALRDVWTALQGEG